MEGGITLIEEGTMRTFGRSRFSLRKLILLIVDMILVNVSAYLTLNLRFDFDIPQRYLAIYKGHIITYTIIVIITYYIFKAYKSLWRYASIEEMISIGLASALSMLVVCGIDMSGGEVLPRGYYFINALGLMFFSGGARFSYRAARRVKNFFCSRDCRTKVMIIGAGKAGYTVVKELHRNPELSKVPVGIIDDDREKLGRNVRGVPVIGNRNDIPMLADEKKVDEILIALPSVSRTERSAIIDICKKTKCSLKTLPGVFELIDGKVDVKNMKDVEIEDLLGRDPVRVDMDSIAGYLKGKRILVTGGGGSIGSELCRQIAPLSPQNLIILDIYENNAYEIQQELRRQYGDDLNLETIIASVRDQKRMRRIFEEYRPEVVFHAAAHKHVPLMEKSPLEAVKNNIFGTLNAARLADEYGAKKFVLISTDKAVNPTNIMGASKRVCEMIVQSIDKHSSTEFVGVRFGNVLGSNGSVIPLFKKQIAEGGPVTVTHPDIIRYFMTIPEAVQLVVQAGAMAKGGEIFVLDMGDPVKIADLAKDLIRLSGLEPDVDINIEYTGLRPGEKLYEELLMAEEGLTDTSHEKIFVGRPLRMDIEKLMREFEILWGIAQKEESALLEVVMKKLVPTYRKSAQVDDMGAEQQECAG